VCKIINLKEDEIAKVVIIIFIAMTSGALFGLFLRWVFN
jgi:hypothetical protein